MSESETAMLRAGPSETRRRRVAPAMLLLAWALTAQTACAVGLAVTPSDGAASDGGTNGNDTASDGPASDSPAPPLDGPAPPTDSPAPPLDTPPPPTDTPVPPPMDAGLPPGTCATSGDCAATPARPVCDTIARRCVRCVVSGDCPSGQMCSSQMCVPACECMAGASRACMTSCGTSGSQRCGADCRWPTACAPPAETCNVRDDDCNGACDDVGGCRTGINRSYSGTSGEHFYTASASEAVCCGFALEFGNYYYLYSAAQPGTVPFYRCYLTSVGKHFYTTSATCEGAAGTNEGPLGYIATSPLCGSTPLYRLVHRSNGDHFYTTSTSERDGAVASGSYIDEGVAGNVWGTPSG